MGGGAKDFLKWAETEIKKAAPKINESVRQVSKDKGQAASGFVAGAVGSVPNTIGTLGTGALGLVKTAIGKENAFKEVDDWNKGYIDIGNKIGKGIFGENYNPQAFHTGAAIGDIAGVSAITKPLAGLARLGKAENVARGIENVGTVLGAGTYGLESQAADIARKRLDPLVNKASGAVPDSVLKGAAKAQESLRGLTDKVNDFGGITPNIKNLLNPRTAEDMLRKEVNPEIFNQISEKYNKPVTNLSEWGELLHKDLYKEITSNKTEALEGKILKLNEQIDKLKSKPSQNSKITERLKEKKAELDNIKSQIENFKKEDLDLSIPEITLNQLQSKLKTDFGVDLKKIDKNSLAPVLEGINEGIQKKGKELSRLNADTNFNSAKELLLEVKNKKLQGLDSIEEGKTIDQSLFEHRKALVDSAYDSIFNKFNQYEKESFKPGVQESYLDSLKNQISENTYDKIKKIKEIDEDAAKELQAKFDGSKFSGVTRLALWGRNENAASDLLQFNRNITPVRDKYLQQNGLLDYDIMGEAKGASKWKDQNYRLLKDQLIDPHLNYADAVKNSINSISNENISASIRRFTGRNPENINKFFDNIGKIIGEAYKTAGYGFQDSARKQIINSIIDDSYAIAKAKGLKVGTEDFNRFVVSTSKGMLEDVGFKPKKTSFGLKEGTQSRLSIDDRFAEFAEKFGGKEAKGISLAMSSWVKSATMSNLQSFNNFKDSLYRISKTGVVTKADKINTVKFALDSIINLGLLGLRGIKLPSLYQEVPSLKDTITEENPQTVGTAVAGLFLDALGADKDIITIFKEGLYGSLTGSSSSRQTSIPVSGALSGTKIAASLIDQKLRGTPDATIISSFIPKDAIAIMNAKLNEEIKGFGGKDITLNYSKNTQESSGLRAMTGGLLQKPISFDPQMGNTIGQPRIAEEEIINKFSGMKLSDFNSSKNIDDLVNTLIDSGIPEDRIDAVIDSITDKISQNSHSKLFTSLKTNKAHWIALDPQRDSVKMKELLEDYSEKDMTQAAAEAVLSNQDDILNIIVKSKIARGDTPEQIQNWIDSIVDESIRLTERENRKKGD